MENFQQVCNRQEVGAQEKIAGQSLGAPRSHAAIDRGAPRKSCKTLENAYRCQSGRSHQPMTVRYVMT